MNKKFAFFDIVVYGTVCLPLFGISLIIGFNGLFSADLSWLKENVILVVIYAFCLALPMGGILFLRYYEINNNDFVYFHYFPFATSWEKAANNIDVRWNQNVFISEIKDVEIIKLTYEEQQTKVFYKHWFNKYLKINLKNGNPKYVYVGNYSNYQIQEIIKTINTTQKI